MGFPRQAACLWQYKLYEEIRNQPTPQRMQEHLRLVLEKPTPLWMSVLNKLFYMWLFVTPWFIYIRPGTMLSGELWPHCLICLAREVLLRITSVVLLFLLKMSPINRGISDAVLSSCTTVVTFKEPWLFKGEPEC